MRPRHTDVLLYGQSIESWMNSKSCFKGALQGSHMEWQYISNRKQTVGSALEYIAERDELQIVAIFNDGHWPQEHLMRDCQLLAKAMAAHAEKPWAALGERNLEYLTPVFEAEGIHVVPYYTPEVVESRWSQRNAELAPASAD